MPTTFLSGPASAPSLGLYASSTTQDLPLGSRFVDQAGNSYRYCKAGAVALVVGTLQQAPIEVTNHQNLTAPAVAIGATSFALTLGATLATANQYAEGWAVITVTPGVGYKYSISSHAAVASAGVITLNLNDAIQVALTASSRVDLVSNPYRDVIINPTTATSNPVGVAIYPIGIGAYGFIQDGGVAVVLADGTVTVGTALVASNATAGAVEALTGVQAAVGNAINGIATTEYGAIKLNLG